MKTINKYVSYLTALIVFLFVQAMAFAQEEGTTSTTKVEINADTPNWFSDNWLWLVGVIVFIILLFALIGGGSSRRRTTVVREDRDAGRVTRTTTVDDDI